MKQNQDTPPDAAAPSINSGQALRRIAEERLKAREQTPPSDVPRAHERLVHELQVHQIELEMQNEQLKQAHAKEDALLIQYTDLYDFAPTGYLTLDREGAIRQVNLTGAHLLGVERSLLVKRRFGQFVSERDRLVFSDFLRAVFAGGTQERCEVALSHEDRCPFVIQIEGTCSADGQECRAVVVDISERASMEKQQQLAMKVLEALNRDNDVTLLVKDILHLIKESMGFEAVGIRLHEGEDFPYVETNGFPGHFVEAERHLCARTPTGELIRDANGDPVLECMCGNVICSRFDLSKPFFTERGSFWSNNTTELLASTTENDRQARTRNRCNGEGYESVALIPLRSGGEVIGLLQLNDHRKGMFTLDMIQFFEEMGAGIGIAVSRKRAAQALRDSEARLLAILDTTPFPIVLVDAQDDKVDYWSRSAIDLFGHTAPTTAEWYQLAYPDPDYRREVIARWKPALEEARSSGKPVNTGEYRVTCHDGSVRICELYATFLNDRLVVTFNDITARKQAEDALRESDRRMRDIISSLADWVWETDEEGVYTYSSLQGSDLLGRTPEEIIGKTPFDFMPSDEAKRVGAIFSELVARKAPIRDLENWNLHKNGQRICLLTSGVPVLDEAGNLKGYRGVDKDITDSKRAEEQLRASELKRRRLFETMNEGVFYQLADGRLVDVNNAALRMFGLSRDEFLGRTSMHSEWDVIREDGTPLPGHEHPSMQALSTGKPVQTPVVGILNPQTQAYTWVSASAIPEFREGEDTPYQVVMTMHDITETRRAATEKDALQVQLSQAQKMESVGRLAGGVAHDFNNMLMGIMNYAELCRDKLEPDHPIREWLNEITVDAERSSKLTHQLLAFARKQIIAPKVIDLNEAIGSMLKLLRRLIGEDVTMKLLADPDTWPVKMDPVQIDQILANLCVNARDAIGGVGLVTIETSNATFDEDSCASHPGSIMGDYALLTVTDTGCGMDKETRENIFEPFFTTKGEGEGTGLGLATVYGIVKQNDGFIYVYSEQGKGTTFKIYLPRVVAAEAAQAASATAAKPPHGTETVLLVEDEKSIRITVHMFLEDLGYSVLVAEDPETALSLAAEHPGEIDLLITDVIMPGMSGRDLANRLLELRPAIKRLFMSGFTADVIAQRGILDDGVNFLSKPFGRDALAGKVRKVLEEEGEKK